MNDNVVLQKIEEIIDVRIRREVRMNKRKDIVQELLDTRLSLLCIFGFIDDVAKVDATNEEIEEYSKVNDGSLSFQDKMAIYRNKRYPLFTDDYGQCDIVIINGRQYSMGTYNVFDQYKSDIGFLAEESYNKEKMNSLFAE